MEQPSCPSTTPIVNFKRTSVPQTPIRNKWPLPYILPVYNFPPQVKLALELKQDLKQPKLRFLRGLFIQSIVAHAMQFTLYPDMGQKRDMARAIIIDYPHLAEGTGSGFGAWYQTITDALKNARRNLPDVPEVMARKKSLKPKDTLIPIPEEQSPDIPVESTVAMTLPDVFPLEISEVLQMPPAISLNINIPPIAENNHRMETQEIRNSKKRKCSSETTVRKTSVSICPEAAETYVESEIYVAAETYVAEMQKIMTMSEISRDPPRLRYLLSKTFSGRRDDIDGRALISELRLKYPAVFTEEGIVLEYEMFSGVKNVMKTARANISCWSKAVMKLAESQKDPKSKLSSKLQEQLKSIDDAVEGEFVPNIERHRLICGIIMLPHLLNENLEFFLKILPVN